MQRYVLYYRVRGWGAARERPQNVGKTWILKDKAEAGHSTPKPKRVTPLDARQTESLGCPISSLDIVVNKELANRSHRNDPSKYLLQQFFESMHFAASWALKVIGRRLPAASVAK